MSDEIKYYANANWASVKGDFTPDQLREIAQEIEDRRRKFEKAQAKKG